MKYFRAILFILPILFSAICHAQEFPLGPVGGRYAISPNLNFARVASLDSGGPGANAGLQVGDFIYGAFGKRFTPTSQLHYGVTQDLGFAIDRAEGGTGQLPLMVLRSGIGTLTITVNLSAAGAFGAAYPRNSVKHRQLADSACDYLHQRALSSNGNLGYVNGNLSYLTGWAGIALLGHPNWNDTAGARPFRQSINKIRDHCVSQINGNSYAPVEDKLYDWSPNPNFQGGADNWQLGQWVMFLSEYYAKTTDAAVLPTIQRGAEMRANSVQWWKQPSNNGYSPGYYDIAGMVGHGGVSGDYLHLGYGGGINICGVHSFCGMAFAKRVGVDMSVRPRDGHYFGFTNPPTGAVPAGMENYNHSVSEKFLMQWNWMAKRSGWFSAGHFDDGHVRYNEGWQNSAWDAAGRTPATLLGMALYSQGETLGADDQDRLDRMKGYITRKYMSQQESHAFCIGAQMFQAFATAFLSDRQQRYSMDNWRFFYALSRTSSGGFQYVASRNVWDSYQDESICAALNVAMPYVIANGGLNLIPGYKVDRLVADFQSPDVTWPAIEARRMSVKSATVSMPVAVVDGAGQTVPSSSYSAAWTKVSGPSSVTFTAPNAATTSITFGSTGNYRVQLVLTKGSYTLTEPIDINVQLTPAPAGYTIGAANYQVYTGIAGGAVSDLIGASKFPNSPDITRTVSRLAGDHGGENYGARLSGCIIPPVTGNYRFYVASDDTSQLKLNPSGLNPTGAAIIASVNGWTNPNEWSKYPSQRSEVFNLTAGVPAYFEALHKEAGGGDNLSIGWSINGGPIEVIDGIFTGFTGGSSEPTTMAIVQQPAPASTTLGGAATLSIGTSGPLPAIYQWRRNGVPFGSPSFSMSATASLTLTNVTGGVEGDYDCVYTTVLGIITSDSARVTVTDAGEIVSGGLWREVYTGISGTSVANLTGNGKFPSFADSSGPIGSAASPDNYADNFGERWTGWVRPAVTGNYRFYLASDDESELWLSTSELPADKARILQLTGYSSPKAWSSRSPSAYIALSAGRAYYIEVRHKDGGGGDHCAIAWQREGQPAPINGSGEVPGQYLSYRVGGSYDDVPVTGNQAPAFGTDPLSRGDAFVSATYTDSLASSAGDFNSTDTLTFSKIDGPAWLNVAVNGMLTGIPQASNLGTNTFTVRVGDDAGLGDTATLSIVVAQPPLAAYWKFNDASTSGTSLDTVTLIPGNIFAPAAYGTDGSGRSGQAGDRSLNLGNSGSGARMEVSNVGFLQQAAQGQKVTISFWQKLNSTSNPMSSFWALSPSSAGQRGMQSHSPWTDGAVYFDCGGFNRVTGTTSGVTWTNWNHIALVRNGSLGQIWVNGNLVGSSGALALLPSDFTRLTVGSADGGGDSMRGGLDDFAVFRTALDENRIDALAAGVAADLVHSVTLPGGWSHLDIGTVGVTGSTGYAEGSFSVIGSGSDIWGTADGFRFVHRSLSGDGEIIARVVSVQNTDPWAKAGVMIRENLSSGSKHALMAITPQQGAAFQCRAATNGSSSHIGILGIGAPYWVRLVRSGNTFSAYHSPDGTSWTLAGSQSISMAPAVSIGLAVTSHNNNASSQAIFDSVSVAATQQALIAGYAAFEGSYGIAGVSADVDADNDGLPNGIEFVIGSDPNSPTSSALFPSAIVDDTHMTFVFRRTDSSAAYRPFVEYGSSLGDGPPAQWIEALDGVDGVHISEIDDGFGPGVDRVNVAFPRDLAVAGRLFARLRVDIP